MRICSITPHHISNNPRIVREADALAEAGHDVRIVAVWQTPERSREDEALARGKKWRLQTIRIEKGANHAAWFITGLRMKTAKILWKILKGKRLSGYAYTRTFDETIGLVLSEPADLIIAHTQPMLAPAYFASLKNGAKWAFDCEDIISEEYESLNASHKALVSYAEKTFMPHASFILSASLAFIPWIRENISASVPVTAVQNVPPLSEGPSGLAAGYPSERKALKLHWFSIALGPHRELEDAVRALALVKHPAELHLRGDMLPSYEESFKAFLQKEGVGNRVFIHPRVAPSEVVRAASNYDVGLALMQPECLCHELATPNKLFFYMMAGLAVIATETKGHLSVLDRSGKMGLMYKAGDAQALAKHIDWLAEHPQELMEFRKSAFEEARSQWNWEAEKKKIIECVKSLS